MKHLLIVLGLCIIIVGAQGVSAEDLSDMTELPGHFCLLSLLHPKYSPDRMLLHYKMCVVLLQKDIIRFKGGEDRGDENDRIVLRNIMMTYALDLQKVYPDGAVFFYRCAKELADIHYEPLEQMLEK